MQAKRPTSLPTYAELCIRALAASDLGHKLSLGGAVGLMHYFEYRPTHDVDAWWAAEVTNSEQRQIVELIEETLRQFGVVRTRMWGEVVSVELIQAGKTIFSFQIAQRSAQLEAPKRSPWGEILLDSFPDLVASKMVALVERGAPRDFRDIYTLCQEEVTTPADCWELWRRRQALSGADTSGSRARLAIGTHLARIEQHRPLNQIADEASRQPAEQLRNWFKTEFLHALDDTEVQQ